MTSQIGKYLIGKISTTSDFHNELVCQNKDKSGIILNIIYVQAYTLGYGSQSFRCIQ